MTNQKKYNLKILKGQQALDKPDYQEYYTLDIGTHYLFIDVPENFAEELIAFYDATPFEPNQLILAEPDEIKSVHYYLSNIRQQYQYANLKQASYAQNVAGQQAAMQQQYAYAHAIHQNSLSLGILGQHNNLLGI